MFSSVFGMAPIVILGVTVIVFVVTRMVGDPVKVMLPLEATLEQRAAFEKQLGLDRPIAVQFGDFLGDLVHLDFGDSLWQHRPAMEIVFEKLPLTMLLAVLGIGLAFLLSIPLGIIAALRPGGIADRVTVFFSLIGLSVPQFWLGLLLIVVFAVQLHWLPTSGVATPAHMIMPAVTLALPALARLVMIVRSSMIDELNQQYVKTGFAKGMPFMRVVGVHALRNAGLPVITLVRMGADPGHRRLFGGGGDGLRLAGTWPDRHPGHRAGGPDFATGDCVHRSHHRGDDQYRHGRGLHPYRSATEALLDMGGTPLSQQILGDRGVERLARLGSYPWSCGETRPASSAWS